MKNKKIYLGMAIIAAVLSTMSANANVLYSTLGPSDEFDSSNGYFVDGSNFFNQVIASPFTVSANSSLADVMVGLNNFAGSNSPVDLFIASNAGGVPGGILVSLTQVGVIPPFNSMALTMFTPDASLSLMVGTTYWLIAQETDPNTEQTWDFAFGDSQNGIAFNQLGSTSGPWNQFFGTDVAFRVDGQMGVPETGSSFLLLGLGLVGVVGFARRPRASC